MHAMNSGGAMRGGGIGETLDSATIERLMALLGSGVRAGVSFEEKRRQIGAGLAAIVEADVWIWARSRMPAVTTDAVIFDVVDGGFQDDGERARFLAALYDPIVSEAFNRALREPAHGLAADPCDRPSDAPSVGGAMMAQSRFVEDAMPEGSPARASWRAASGMDAGMMSMVPLGGPSWSGLGFHRRIGRPAFTRWELCAMHLAVTSVDALHRDGSDVAANTDRLFSFRPRERQVLLYLLAGDQAKQIATKLGISPHTVADYVKVIYRRLDVSTRTELLRLFLPGMPPT